MINAHFKIFIEMQAQEETNKAKVTYYFRKEGSRHVHVIRRSAFFEIYFACTSVTHRDPVCIYWQGLAHLFPLN